MEEKSQKLVSVGIPTYNRPEGLKRVLECITNQSYKNLEIIVSDNCSSYSEVVKVLLEFSAKDKRIKYFIQKENKGVSFNFDFVLKKATGEYFMWASDDDEWENNFIDKCLNEFGSNQKYVAVIMEAQYFSSKEKFLFFPEGEPFYNFYSDNVKDRIFHILKYNYGNLYYSLFKRSVLFKNGKSIVDINSKSLNEIPLFLSVASIGNWKIISEVGFYKKTNIKTYKQAKWEKQGGRLPGHLRLSYFLSLYSVFVYHLLTLKEINIKIISLGIDVDYFKKVALKNILKHFYYFLIGYKPLYFKK